MKKAALAVALMVAALAGCGGSTPASYTGSVHPGGWGSTPPGVTLPAPLLQAVPSATMYDSILLSTVPSHPFAAAGYTSGNWPTYLPMRSAWPTAHVVSIAINTSHHADCLDVEPGDASPSQAGPWARADIAAGFKRPCLYSDLSEMPAVKASLAAAGLARSQYFLWLAWYRYVPGLIAGYDAVQWTDRALGRNLDESTVTLNFLTIAQPPYVAPKPRPAPQPPVVLPLCFHKREAASACAAAKAKIASDLRAAAASRRALKATEGALTHNRCKRPYRRGVCIRAGRDAHVFAQRVRYFNARAAKLRAAN